jgi:hypothetical protein
MYSESVCQVARSCVDVGSFHTRLVVRFMIFTASLQTILNTASYSTAAFADVISQKWAWLKYRFRNLEFDNGVYNNVTPSNKDGARLAQWAQWLGYGLVGPELESSSRMVVEPTLFLLRE